MLFRNNAVCPSNGNGMRIMF